MYLHTYLCKHANGTPSDYVSEAIKKGYQEIAITDHGPLIQEIISNFYTRRMDFNDYNNKYLNYLDFREHVIKVIGKSNKCSEYILYTPILRKIKNECHNVYECMIRILTDDDSIAYNLLLSFGVDIEAFYLSIVKNEII